MFKKTIATAIAITLVLASLTACAPTDIPNQTASKTITEYTTEGKETKLVGDPNATGELTVDLTNMFFGYSTHIEKMYAELYPNVKLDLTVWDDHIGDASFDWESEFVKSQTEAMAGKGPDVFAVIDEVSDPYKMMKAGACADLTSYFENDKNFNIDDFNKAVFYTGQLDGKQYIVPTQYHFPLFMTTQSIVDNIGFDLAKCKDYFSTGEEFGRVLKDNKLNLDPKSSVKWLFSPYHLLTYSGIPWINYKSDIANLNTPEIEDGYRMLKESFFPYLQSSRGGSGMTDSFLEAGLFMEEKSMFAELTSSNRERIIMNSKALTGSGEKPVIFPWRNINGGITSYAGGTLAVSSNSKNKQNAYNFIKMLLSEELYKSMYEDESNNMAGLLGDSPSINNNVVRYLFEQDKGTIGEKTPYFDGLSGYQLEYVPDEIIEQYIGFTKEVDSAYFDPKVMYDIYGMMQPYLEDKATYEECVQKAQNMLDIYISE